MQFNHFLTSYMPDAGYGAGRLYRDLIEQAVHADRLGYAGVSIPEHHLVNILMIPSPLQMAVKIATLASRLEIVTAVAVLPVRNMRVFAGEVIQAQILCDERLVLGVGRGAFAYELARLGVPIEITREKFDESLAVLEALLGGEEVTWSGKYYQVEPLTVMPRPCGQPIPIVKAAMAPEAIHASARKGYSIQTTPLEASHDVLLGQVDAFKRGQAEAGTRGTAEQWIKEGKTHQMDAAVVPPVPVGPKCGSWFPDPVRSAIIEAEFGGHLGNVGKEGLPSR